MSGANGAPARAVQNAVKNAANHARTNALIARSEHSVPLKSAGTVPNGQRPDAAGFGLTIESKAWLRHIRTVTG